MASIRKLKSGYRAEVARQGVRKSRVFPTKQAAKDWAARAEYELLNGDKIAEVSTFGALMDRYARERSPQKRGGRSEVFRLESLQRDSIADKKLGVLPRPQLIRTAI